MTLFEQLMLEITSAGFNKKERIRKIKQKPEDGGQGGDGEIPQDAEIDPPPGTGTGRGGKGGKNKQDGGKDKQDGGKSGEPGTIEIDGEGNVIINGKKSGQKVFDPETHASEETNENDFNDIQDIFDKVYTEVEDDMGGREEVKKAIGSGKGGILGRVYHKIYPSFNFRDIMKRLNTFKRLIGVEYSNKGKIDTYNAALHNPVSQTGDMIRPMSVKNGQNVEASKNSALLIFACDTSGSIGPEEYEAIDGLLEMIAEEFEKKLVLTDKNGKKIGSIGGEVYMVEWDDGTHLPLRKWSGSAAFNHLTNEKFKKKQDKNKSYEGNPLKLRGGGGTNVQKLFTALDQKFTKTDPKSNRVSFFLDEKDPGAVIFSKDFDNIEDARLRKQFAKSFTAPLTPIPKKDIPTEMNGVSQKTLDSHDVVNGSILTLEGAQRFSNVPFLIIFSDGYFEPPNYKTSKLFGNNPGNILYVITTKDGIGNCRPFNVLYWDIEKKED